MISFDDLKTKINAQNSKLDAQAVVIAAHGDTLSMIQTQLAALLAAGTPPTQADLQALSDSIDQASATLDGAVLHLTANDPPPPAPAPAPVTSAGP